MSSNINAAPFRARLDALGSTASCDAAARVCWVAPTSPAENRFRAKAATAREGGKGFFLPVAVRQHLRDLRATLAGLFESNNVSKYVLNNGLGAL